MPRAWLPIKKLRQAGFSTVEVLLAATLFAFLATAVAGALIYGRQSTTNAGNRSRAIYLAEEGLEGARNIRDNAYTNLVDGTYGLTQSSGQWVLSGSSDTAGAYTRQVTISTVDTARKNITSTVSWADGSVSRSTQLVTRLANWRSSYTPPTWTNTTLAGSLSLASRTTGRRVATQGDYAYVVMSSGTPSFYIIDISTGSSPTIVGSLSTLAASPISITVDGNYAYIVGTNNNAEMQIINVSNPAAPAIVGTFNAAGTADAYGVRVSGNYAYVSRLTNSGTNEVQIVNVATKTAPTLTGSYGLAQNMRDLCAMGNNLYVVTDSDTQEILVLSIATPSAPSLVTSVNLTGTVNPASIECLNNVLFVGHGTAIRAVNVTTPSAPSVVGNFTASGTATINDISVDTTNSILFLATTNTTAELQVVNAATPTSMTLMDTVDVPGTTSTLNGVAFSSMLNVTAAVGASATQGFTVFKPN